MKDPRPGDIPDSPSLFDKEVEKFRAVLTGARSATLLQLFDFLVKRSSDERAPKEIEIALAVFGRDGAQDATANSLDSGVRVSVHRLRKRLDEFYAGKAGPKLEIPKGEYRIVLAAASCAAESEQPKLRLANIKWPKLGARSLAIMLCVLLAILSGGLVLRFLWPNIRAELAGQELRATTFWQPFGSAGQAQIVVGDSFLVAETENQQDVQRMLLEPGIHSREDLGDYLKTHPDAFYRLYDLDLSFAPAGTAIAAWDVQNAVASVRSDTAGQVRLIPASKLLPEALGKEDIVYVGRFSSLGRVAAPLFQTSHMRLGDTYNELVDLPSGKRFVADLDSGQKQRPQVDFGYIASLSGPLGKHIFVIAGIGDTAVQNMASLVSSPERLRTVETRAAIHGDYEALFEIRIMGDVALNQGPVFVRAIP